MFHCDNCNKDIQQKNKIKHDLTMYHQKRSNKILHHVVEEDQPEVIIGKPLDDINDILENKKKIKKNKLTMSKNPKKEHDIY